MRDGHDFSYICIFRRMILAVMIVILAWSSCAEAVDVHDISGGGGGTVTNSWHISGSLSPGGGQLAHKITLQDGITLTASIDAYSFDIEHPKPFTHKSKIYALPNTNITLSHDINIQDGYKLAYTVDGAKISGNEFVMQDNDTVIGAVNVLVVYEVSYDLSGGGAVPENPLRYTVESDDFTLKRPERVGYDFAGWIGEGLTEASKDLTIPQGSTGNRKYTATWTPTTYTISYALNGGNVSPSNPTSYNIESASFTLNNPTREGYTFTGWTGTGINETSSSVTIAKGSTGNREYTATFTPITYNIIYSLNGGSANNPASYNIESTSFTLNNPTREGYTFTGWTGTGIEGSSSSVTIVKGSTGARTYTATFTPITYTITYNLNGGNATNPTSYNIESDSFTLNNPTKEGYTFTGWTGTGINGTSSSVTILKGSTGNRTYTATFTPITYAITYNLDGGNATNTTSYNIESASFTLNNPTREGYTFTGWTGTGINGSSSSVTIAKGSTGTRTYTATFSPITYNITYNLDGGNATNPTSYNIESASFTLNNPTKEGYTFTGWTGTGIEGSSSSVTIVKGSTGARTYTATFTLITYAITYNLNGGNATNPTSYNIESTSFTLNNPTREGYTFTGWTGTGINGSSSSVTIVKGLTGARTYTATFTPITYAITYNLNGGNATNPTSYNIESNSFTLNNPTREGYTFTGWTGTGISGTSSSVTIAKGSTGTRTYTATFSPITYNITYNLDGGNANNPTSYNIESTSFTLNNPTKDGYTFAGWTGTGIEGLSSSVTVAKGSTGARTYTATFTPITYNITYTLNGGSASNPASYNIESASFTLSNPTKDSYTFMGWTGTNIEGSSSNVTIAKGSTGARTYTATFTPITYNITYNLNNGNATNPASYNIESDSFTLNNPTKEGYTFTGWTGTGIEGTSSSVTIAKGSTGARTYTATFTPITYNITYNLDGGNATNPTSYNIESASFTLNNPTKEGYTFTGWTGTGIEGLSSSVTVAKGSTGAREYTATFTPITYNITYNLDGGISIGNPSAYNIESGDIHLTHPMKNGYDFIGWSYNGVNSKDFTIPHNSSGNIELKALWSLHAYTISYDLHGGTSSPNNPTAYTIESEDFTLINPEKPCYVFTGWAGSADIDSSMDVTILKDSSGDRNYSASWRPITYTISYDLKGGYVSSNNPTSYNVESEAFKLNAPNREGYIFMGWKGKGLTEASTDVFIPAGSSRDRKYTATWKAITFTLNYDLKGGILSANNPSSYDIETESFTLKNPVRVAYIFIGWTGTGLDVPAMSVTIPKGSTGTKSYTALWQAVTYNISYTLNGANDPGNPKSYSVESSDTALKNPSRNGYTFSGWTGTGLTAKTQAVTIPAGSIGDREYTAHFTPITYAITYTLNGGKANNPSSYTIETNTFTLNNPVRAGYVFTGWTSISDGITEPQNIVSVSKGNTGDKDFTATWSAKVYEISYDLCGGTFSGEYIAYYTTESGDVKLKTPVKNGYEFIGWSVEGEEGISEDMTIPGGSMNDRKYVANWKPKAYSLTYNLDGGSVSPDNPSSYTVETESFTLNNPMKAGYIFAGWTGTSLDAETIIVTIPQGSTGGRNYTAHFTPIIYALSYDLDGGNSSGNPASYTIESNDIYLAHPTKAGYDFRGWSFDGTISLDLTIPNGSIGSREFKALWAVHVYTISYDLNGGNITGNPSSYTVESNDIHLACSTRTGYDFLGWSFDGGISLDVTIPHSSIGNKKFKALWAIHIYAIRYNLNGATATGNPSSYTIDTPAFTLNNPAKNGYTFTGWTGSNLNSPATAVTIPQGSTGNLNYTARFTPITYTITYNLEGGTLPYDSPESYDIESRALTLINPTKLGFIFTGWTGADSDTPQITVTIPQGSTGNRIYTAHYTEAQEDYPPEITAESFILNATKGQPVSLIISASSNEIPQWTLSGILPEGLAFTASDYSAEISGIPEAGTSGAYSLNVIASNSAGTSSADILINIAGYSTLSKDTRNTHTAFRDNAGNLILSADIAIIIASHDFTAEPAKTLAITASIDIALELYDSDYDTYIYALDMAGLPQWLNVSGEITSHDFITSGKSYHHHAFTLTGIPESSHGIDDITLTAIVKVSGDIPVLEVSADKDITISAQPQAPVLHSPDESNSGGDSITVNVRNFPPVIESSSYELTLTAGNAISPITITALEGTNLTWTHEGSLPEGLSLTHDTHSMIISGTVSKNAGAGQYIFTAKATNDSGHDEATIIFNVMRQSVIMAGDVELSLSDFEVMTENEIAEILGDSEAVILEGFAEDISEVIMKIDRSAGVKHVDLSSLEGVNEIALDSLSSIESINLSGNNSATHITITHSNALKAIDLSGSNAVNVNLHGCQNLESMNALNCGHLETFNAPSCGLDEIEIDGCLNLREIDIRFNRLRRFDASELGNLMSLDDGGQSVNVDEIATRINMLSFIEGDISASGIVYASGAVNVKNLKGYDIFGNEIQSTYDSATGEAIFDSAPAVVTYDYVTGFRDNLMDVTISGIERGNESTNESVSEQADSGDGGGGCLNVKLIVCAAIVIALMFLKGGIKN